MYRGLSLGDADHDAVPHFSLWDESASVPELHSSRLFRSSGLSLYMQRLHLAIGQLHLCVGLMGLSWLYFEEYFASHLV